VLSLRSYIIFSLQTSRQEIVDHLTICMKDALRKFSEVNGKLPSTIFFYRDGVGDKMLGLVLDHELPQVLKAVSFFPSYSPKFIMLVVKKRIHTRFFEQYVPIFLLHIDRILSSSLNLSFLSRQEEGLPLSNPLPGTVVDSGCIHPNWYEFFLVSQSTRQGLCFSYFLPFQPLLSIHSHLLQALSAQQTITSSTTHSVSNQQNSNCSPTNSAISTTTGQAPSAFQHPVVTPTKSHI
jgi:hypothetical protein